MPRDTALEVARRVFAALQQRFPQLRFDTPPRGQADLLFSIPKQPGLAFDIVLYLTGDTLHLQVGEILWLEYFPCDQQPKARAFEEAAAGLITGDYRIVETWRAERPAWATLETRHEGLWHTVATSGRFHLPFGQVTTTVLHNDTAEASPPE